MNILLDFIPLMNVGGTGGVGGAASFTKAVCDNVIRQCRPTDKLFATIDSRLSEGRLYNHVQYAAQHHVQLLDLASETPAALIGKNNIDTFFIAIGQYYATYDLNGITCKTIMFIHDLFDMERTDNMIDLLLMDKNTEHRWQWFKRCSNLFIGRWNRNNRQQYGHIMPLYTAPNTVAYTVSDYSRNALNYFFPEIAKDIKVCYSPMKQSSKEEHVSDEQLRNLITGNHTYLLLLAANRKYKNPKTVLKVFSRLQAEYPDLYLVTTRYGKTIHPRHIDISHLSESDLEHAYQHATALVFASFFEGFGYPPMEAMKYGTPVIASNVTSIPEVLGDAAVYFSPFYPADLYRAYKQLMSHRKDYQEKALRRYREISARQQADLEELTKQLLTK